MRPRHPDRLPHQSLRRLPRTATDFVSLTPLDVDRSMVASAHAQSALMFTLDVVLRVHICLHNVHSTF